jgi:hypothetical protein
MSRPNLLLLLAALTACADDPGGPRDPGDGPQLSGEGLELVVGPTVARSTAPTSPASKASRW